MLSAKVEAEDAASGCDWEAECGHVFVLSRASWHRSDSWNRAARAPVLPPSLACPDMDSCQSKTLPLHPGRRLRRRGLLPRSRAPFHASGLLEENSRKCFPALFLWCLAVRVTVAGSGGGVVNPLLFVDMLQAAPR